MNYETLDADVNCILDKHFTPGRSGKKVKMLVVHYNAGDLTVEQCYNVWQTREASAQYQVESNGRTGQLVWDSDTAWHASNWDANCTSIGIEHANKADGTITEACLDAGAHLVAALCKHFGLGRPQWLVNVFPHKYFAATSCPGQIYGSQKDAYIQRAQKWYDSMVGGAQASSGGTSSKPSTPSTKYAIGQHVVFSTCYTSSTAPNSEAIAAANMARNHGTITRIVSGAKNPYLLDNGLCWVNDGDIRGFYNGPSSAMSARQFALEVWNEGKHGTGATRQAEAKRLGVDPDEAQRLINILASGGKI